MTFGVILRHFKGGYDIHPNAYLPNDNRLGGQKLFYHLFMKISFQVDPLNLIFDIFGL
jgi:hypothetical protein